MKKIILAFLLFSLPSISYWNNFTKIVSNDVTLEFITYNVESDMFDIKVWVSETTKSLTDISKEYWAISGQGKDEYSDGTITHFPFFIKLVKSIQIIEDKFLNDYEIFRYYTLMGQAC